MYLRDSIRQHQALAVRGGPEPGPGLQLGAVAALAADRYGSLAYIGEPATPEVNAAIESLRRLLQGLAWPPETSQEPLTLMLWLLEILAQETAGGPGPDQDP